MAHIDCLWEALVGLVDIRIDGCGLHWLSGISDQTERVVQWSPAPDAPFRWYCGGKWFVNERLVFRMLLWQLDFVLSGLGKRQSKSAQQRACAIGDVAADWTGTP